MRRQSSSNFQIREKNTTKKDDFILSVVFSPLYTLFTLTHTHIHAIRMREFFYWSRIKHVELGDFNRKNGNNNGRRRLNGRDRGGWVAKEKNRKRERERERREVGRWRGKANSLDCFPCNIGRILDYRSNKTNDITYTYSICTRSGIYSGKPTNKNNDVHEWKMHNRNK